MPTIPALQKDTRTRNGHASTAIEGNPLTLEQVRALEEGRELVVSDERAEREVLNYFAGLRYIEKKAKLKRIRYENLFKLHQLLADKVMDQGQAGSYRIINVRVGNHVPPPTSSTQTPTNSLSYTPTPSEKAPTPPPPFPTAKSSSAPSPLLQSAKAEGDLENHE